MESQIECSVYIGIEFLLSKNKGIFMSSYTYKKKEGPGSSYGYIFEGGTWEISTGPQPIAPGFVSIIDRMQFPFDSGIAIQVGNLYEKRYGGSACNSFDSAYIFGGYGTNQDAIDRIIFPFDSGNSKKVGKLSNPASINP